MSFDVSGMKVSQLQKEVIAGLSSGLLTILITHPLDLIKIRLQLSKEANSTYKSIIKNTILLPISKTQVKNERSLLRNFYKGLTINLIGNSSSWGLYFFLYRYYKDAFSGLSTTNLSAYQRDKSMNGINYMLAAWSAGFTTTLLTNPIWVLKTRIMSPNNINTGNNYQSIPKTISHIYKTEGIPAFFTGLLPAIVGVSQGAVYFSIYDTLKVRALGQKDDHERKITALESMSITCISKMTATLLFYPIQTIKSNMQDHGMVKRSLFQTISSVYKRNGSGLRNLYRGLSANLARSLPATCITFYTYETVKHLLP